MTASSDASHLQVFKRLYPKEYLEKCFKQSVRADGRHLSQRRPTSVTPGIITSANSSVLVRIGKTTALAGIKCEVMSTTEGSPDRGQLIITVELPPLCSAATKAGRSSETAAVLTAQLNSIFQEDSVVNTRQLCIFNGKAAWAVYLDIYILDSDGSLLDAAVLASVIALENLELSAVEFNSDTGNVVSSSASGSSIERRKLVLASKPEAMTIALYMDGPTLLIDPTHEEQELADSSVQVVANEKGQLIKLEKCGGKCGLTAEQLMMCVTSAMTHSAKAVSLQL